MIEQKFKLETIKLCQTMLENIDTTIMEVVDLDKLSNYEGRTLLMILHEITGISKTYNDIIIDILEKRSPISQDPELYIYSNTIRAFDRTKCLISDYGDHFTNILNRNL